MMNPLKARLAFQTQKATHNAYSTLSPAGRQKFAELFGIHNTPAAPGSVSDLLQRLGTPTLEGGAQAQARRAGAHVKPIAGATTSNKIHQMMGLAMGHAGVTPDAEFANTLTHASVADKISVMLGFMQGKLMKG